MRRREFITLLGGAAAWPLAARAQQPAMPVIGLLSPESADLWAARLGALRQGLGEAGYVEGRNVTIEYRWAESHSERFPALAADLVRRRVTVIAALASAPLALAVKGLTTTIPIVFVTTVDPVGYGLVASLNQPGGNVTGVTTLSNEVGPKRLELLHELVPKATSIALLVNPGSPAAETQLRDLQSAAHTLGLQIDVLHASTDPELDAVFAALDRLRPGALLIGNDAFFTGRSEQIAAMSLRHALPAIYQFREFTAAGGLMSYGASFADSYRPAGLYIGRILKGEKPADLPVQQATRIELVINLKTAKSLGLDMPLALLTRADEVIE
jgi:putative ABC transport system substrate-binding protein